MREMSFLKILFCLFLLTGCGANQQWVKEYVDQEVTSAKIDFRERLQPLEQALDSNNAQGEAIKKNISNLDVKLNQFTEKLVRFTASLEELNLSYQKGLQEVKRAMSADTQAVSDRIKDLNRKIQKLGKGLIIFQKSLESFDKKLEESRKAEAPAK
jgi:chromosome segregation ATPase